MTLLQALGPGAHVIVPDDAYFGTIKLVRDVFGPWGLELSIVDMTDLANVERAHAAEHEARLDRDAVQSAAPRRRHRRRSPTIAHDGGAALRRRQHVGHARAAAPARARRRRRRCTRRRSTSAATATCWAAR